MTNYNIDIINEKIKNNGLNVILVGEYFSLKHKGDFLCLDCGYKWNTRVENVLKLKKCKCCGFKKSIWNKIPEEIVIEQMLSINKDIKILGEYKRKQSPILIECLKCGHTWKQTPERIIQGRCCPKCSRRKLTPQKILERKNSINRFLKHRNIEMTGDFINVKTETVFYSYNCGHSWTTTPEKVLIGRGCRYCAGNLPKTKEEINIYFEKNNRNMKLVGEYINSNTRTTFLCLKCNWIWNTAPNHVCGTDSTECPNCGPGGGFNPSKKSILYYVKMIFNDNIYYKIGITNKTVEKRFTKKERKHTKMEVLFIENYEFGLDAYNKEQEILKEFNEYRYNGEPILNSGGNTEIFIQDVFNGNYNI